MTLYSVPSAGQTGLVDFRYGSYLRPLEQKVALPQMDFSF